MRRAGIVFGIAAAFVAAPATAFAHGIGGRSDLPVPLEYFLVGAAIVLMLSFAALAVLWPSPRLQDGPRYRGRGRRISPWMGRAAGGAGVVVLGLVVAAGIFGSGGTRNNLAPFSIWILFWLVLPFAAALVGNVWSAVNPWAALGRLMRFGGPPWPGRLGVYPAAGALIAFVWLELIHVGSGDPGTLGWAALGYTAYLLTISAVVGVDRAMAGSDAFTVYHRLISGLAPFGRDGNRIRWRGWLRALPVLPPWRGVAVFTVAMIGTVTYDGLSGTLVWDDVTFALVGTQQGSVWFRTASLLVIVGAVGAAHLLASWVARRVGRSERPTSEIAASFAHTLIPIALAYAVAHYLTLIAFEGQLIIPVISDPFGQGWDLFGTADYRINYTWLSPVTVWWLQMVVVVGGHAAGVVLAHDRALAVFPTDRAVRSQYAMLALMVGLTALALTVLATG